MSGFKRHIGVYYIDKNWASNIFDELVEYMKREIFTSFSVGNSDDNKIEYFINDDRNKNNIDKITKCRFAMEIELKNGSIIKILPATDISKQRNYSFHEVYLQKGINYKTYKEIIKHCTSIGDGLSFFIVSDINDFYFRTSADKYYKENKGRKFYGNSKKQSK